MPNATYFRSKNKIFTKEVMQIFCNATYFRRKKNATAIRRVFEEFSHWDVALYTARKVCLTLILFWLSREMFCAMLKFTFMPDST